ncbi:hypothetical protein D9M68_881210 [compost metagenome]
MAAVTLSRISISRFSAVNLWMRQISQREAKTLPTVRFSTPSSLPRNPASPSCNAAKPEVSCGRAAFSAGSGRKPAGVRSNSSMPSRSSARRKCWLTAPMVTPSSSAAGASAPRRATISMARSALSGMGKGFAI